MSQAHNLVNGKAYLHGEWHEFVVALTDEQVKELERPNSASRYMLKPDKLLDIHPKDVPATEGDYDRAIQTLTKYVSDVVVLEKRLSEARTLLIEAQLALDGWNPGQILRRIEQFMLREFSGGGEKK